MLRRKNGRAVIMSFGAGLISRLGQLAMAVVLARAVGVSSYGSFTFALGLATLAGQFATLGWSPLCNRLIPAYIRDQNWRELKGLRNAGEMVVMAGTGTAALILYFVSSYAAHLQQSLQFAAFLTPVCTFMILRRQQLAAVRKAAIGLLFDQGFAAVLVAVSLLIWATSNIGDVALRFTAAAALGIAIGTFIFYRALPKEVGPEKASYRLWPWLVIALPMLIGLSSRLMMNKIDILMLGPLSTLEQLGLYGAAFRVTFMLSFPQVVLMTVLTPLFSEAFAHHNIGRVRRLLRIANIYGLITTLPVALVLLLFPAQVMALIFGADFTDGGPILAVLAMGQMAAALTIPFSSIMMMGGRERAFGLLNIGALGLDLALCAALIPEYGGLGAAIASTVTTVSLLIGQYFNSRPLLRDPKDPQ